MGVFRRCVMSGMLRTKRCFYEVLGIPKAASEEAVKQAYREAVLLWHPDKNIDNAAEATIRFKEIQNAYETLSDHEKREWYDEPEEELDLRQFTNEDCFEGFEEGEKSFFQVYRAVFEQLVADERDAKSRRQAMKEQMTGDEFEHVPASFGGDDESWEGSLQRLYSEWQNHSCRQSCFWADLYDVRDYTEKAAQMAADKENQRLRSIERRKATKQVRDLVRFVKQIDPRVPEEERAEGYVEVEEPADEAQADCDEDPTEQAELDAFFMLSQWMIGIGLESKQANKYTGALCDEGHDTILAIAALDVSEFKGLGIRNKGHVGLILSEALAVKEATQGSEPEPVADDDTSAAAAEEVVDDDEFFSRGAVAKKEKKEKTKKEKKKPIKRQTASGRFSGGGGGGGR